MRAPLEALKKLSHSDVGKRVRRGLVDYLTEHLQAMNDILRAVGMPKGTYDQNNEHVWGYATKSWHHRGRHQHRRSCHRHLHHTFESSDIAGMV